MKKIILLCLFLSLSSTRAFAAGDHVSVGAGLINFPTPSKTYFELSLEYEHRYDAYFGVGGFGSYVFSTPAITILGVPEVFFHPMAGTWVITASPIFQFYSGNTDTGVRLGTRFRLPAGLFTLLPSVAVDFINGVHQYTFGLGIGF